MGIEFFKKRNPTTAGYNVSETLMAHPIVTKAFLFASQCFDGVTRGTSYTHEVPELTHSVQVAEVLERTVDYDPNLVAAGLTHDTKEEKKATLDQIRAALNDEVATMVDEVSLDTSIKGRERRERQLASLDTISLNSRRLKVADRAVNLLNLAFDPPEGRRLENKINYFLSSKQLFERADIPDLRLRSFAEEALMIAERTIMVGVRDRLARKGPNAKFDVEGDISDIIERAKLDLAIMPDLYDERGKPIQIHADLDDLYEDGTRAHKEIAMVVKHIADLNGYMAVIPGLKTRDRAEEVVHTRMQDDARYINDIARVSLVCKTMEDVNYSLHMLSHSYPNAIIYNRFENPPSTGYRDMKLIVRSDRSHFAEIQVHLESYWNAKMHRGDEIYKKIRELGCRDSELSPADKKARRTLYSESRDLYNAAGEIHGFVMPKTFATCEPSRYVPPVKKDAMEINGAAKPELLGV